MLPVAKNPKINAAIRAAYEAAAKTGITKREVARQVYGDAERWREFDRYLKVDGPTPGPSVAVAIARALGEAPHAFLAETPLESVATELGEANRLAASTLARLEALERVVAELPTTKDVQRGFESLSRMIRAQANPGTGETQPGATTG